MGGVDTDVDAASGATASGQPSADPSFMDLLDFQPDWCLFWAGSVVDAHFAIWRPYLARSKNRFLVLARKGTISERVLTAIAELPNCLAMEATEESMRGLKPLPSLKGFIYVLGFKSATFTNVNSFRNHLHVWIGHGESEKQSSGPRSASIYDSVFVANYRSLRRFPRSIRRWVSSGACAIGAPIMEGAVRDPWAMPRPIRTILYAPTWEGYSDATDYSSLPELGKRLAAILPELRERGVTVILRPHPSAGTRRRPHAVAIERLFAAGAVASEDKVADFAAADVMIADVSGVTGEWLFTEKPAIMVTSPRLANIGRTRERLRADYPWAYQWDLEHDDLLETMQTLEGSDPLRDVRAASAKATFRGHRTLDEAVRTFDLALSCVHLRRSRIAVRHGFEAQMRIGPIRGFARRITPVGGADALAADQR